MPGRQLPSPLLRERQATSASGCGRRVLSPATPTTSPVPAPRRVETPAQRARERRAPRSTAGARRRLSRFSAARTNRPSATSINATTRIVELPDATSRATWWASDAESGEWWVTALGFPRRGFAKRRRAPACKGFVAAPGGYPRLVARAIWSGAISFGLVSVPVKMYSAVERRGVQFNQLARDSGARISMRRVDSSTGEEVPFSDIVKGYELTPGNYVVIEPEELDELAPRRTRTIEIEDFVELAQIDPIYYDHPYYLAPATGGAKPYRLLLDAMRETGRVAIAQVVIRSKEQLVALRATGEVLTMSTMVFADEVLPPGRIGELADVREAKTTKRELDIAKQLIESLAGDFEPERYHDTYREEVLAMIERKAQGRQVRVEPAPKEQEAGAPDLMAALKASLDAAREAGAKPRASRTPKKAAKPPRKKAAAKARPKPRG